MGTKINRPGGGAELETDVILASEDTLGEIKAQLSEPLITKRPIKEYPFGATGTTAISATTTIGIDLGRECELLLIEALFSAAPTTSESLALTLLSHRGATYNVVIFSINPSLTSLTSLVRTWGDGEDGAYPLALGDEVRVTFTHTDSSTIAGRIVVRAKA